MKRKFNFVMVIVALFSILLVTNVAGAADAYKTYANDRFAYSVEYPDIFWSRFESDNGDGVRLESANGRSSLVLWGQFNIEQKDAKQLLKDKLEESAHIVPDSDKSGDGWYSFTVTDDGAMNGIEHHFLEYGIVTQETIVSFIFKYPANGQYDEAAERLKKSLKFGESKGDALGQKDVKEWSSEYEFNIDDEKVYRVRGDKKEFAGDPQKVESGAGVYYWLPVSSHVNEAMEGSEDAIYFFYETGLFLCVLQGVEVPYAGNVSISPNGNQLLIDFGTSPVRELKLYDFRTLKEKRSFLTMSEFKWIDDWRFAMTELNSDKTRPSNSEITDRMSAAIYDSALGEIVYISEATDTSDFILDGVDIEKRQFKITERSVKNPKDWAKEEKIKTRQIKVDFPPAG